MASWTYESEGFCKPMKIQRLIFPIVSVLIIGVLCVKIESHTEKQLLLSFFENSGFQNVRIIDLDERRGLLSLHSSAWKILADGGNNETFDLLKFDHDVISKIPPVFGDSTQILASWRSRYKEQDFYCCRSEKFVYICIYHY